MEDKIICEKLQSWGYSKEVDNIANIVKSYADKGGSINRTFNVDGHSVHVEYPTLEHDDYTLADIGYIYIGCPEPFDEYDFKNTLYHELEHSIKNDKGYQVGKSYNNLKINNGSFQNTNYNDVTMDDSLLEHVEDILYYLWDKDEREAHLADYVQNKKFMSDLKTLIYIVQKKGYHKLLLKDKPMEKFWICVGKEIYSNKKNDFINNKQNPKQHTPLFYFNYFIKKSLFLYNKTLEMYQRNIAKSPIQSQWLNNKID